MRHRVVDLSIFGEKTVPLPVRALEFKNLNNSLIIGSIYYDERGNILIIHTFWERQFLHEKYSYPSQGGAFV